MSPVSNMREIDLITMPARTRLRTTWCHTSKVRQSARLGDLWQLGRHRLLCGDARDRRATGQLMGAGKAGLVFTDPPYNVPIGGHVSRPR